MANQSRSDLFRQDSQQDREKVCMHLLQVLDMNNCIRAFMEVVVEQQLELSSRMISSA